MFDSGSVLMVRLSATGLGTAGYQDCTDQVNRSVYNVGNLKRGNGVIGANRERTRAVLEAIGAGVSSCYDVLPQIDR